MTDTADRRAGHRCAFCGHPEQLHRTRDAQWDRLAAGEPIEAVAADYGTTPFEMTMMWTDLDERLVEQIVPGWESMRREATDD